VPSNFAILLDVGHRVRGPFSRNNPGQGVLALSLAGLALTCAGFAFPARPSRSSQAASAEQQPASATAQSASQPTPATPPPQSPAPQAPAQRPAPNIFVLDPAHGGTDPGARGTGGIRESEIVIEFAAQIRTALEALGFQVIQTRQGNENPSFDDRSAIANAQRGAIFVTLHVASTDLPAANDSTGLIPWERAQAPFLPLSRRFGDLVQGFLAVRFKGSPGSAQVAAVRQLRTTAAPAIAVEVSSVSVDDRGELDRMAPGVADAIARGASAFRPSYVVTTNPGERP
jgi:N-acetylmuramoyl-L-alanine amidase